MVSHAFKSLIFFITMTVTLFACAGSSEPKNKMKLYYGHYEVVDIERYSGGLTTIEQAKQRIGDKITICPTIFSDFVSNIKPPVYKMEVEKVEKEEGVVPPKNSVFYGFMPERDFIHYIEVFKTIDAKYFYTRYEVIGQNKLMKSFDGFFYKVDKIASCQ
ncbi:hypothetical protein [Shewanella surugensis]|uniref:Lipoprotein n=1 Tax=Shewanella surugensis TaxID=212020 RepID=A0ABT0L5L8_9GAMM|nr:hypothetical protein [Shewanella surugensis]MCL1122984.1 hypothetical protein [Shewanella surugensis]